MVHFNVKRQHRSVMRAGPSPDGGRDLIDAQSVWRPLQITFGIVEENAGENVLHMRVVSKGMTIHVPQGERSL